VIALACAFEAPVALGQTAGAPHPAGWARVEGASAGAEIAVGAASPGPLAPDAALPTRCEVRTSGEPLRFVLADGTRLELAPHGRLRRAGTVDIALGGLGKRSAERLELIQGELLIEAPPTAHAGSVLITSHDVLVAPLPGALVRARALGADVLGVAVHQGEARFLTRGAWRVLLAGQAVEAAAALPAPPPTVLPAAPGWSTSHGACAPAGKTGAADCSITCASDDAPAPLALAWSAPAGATGYVLEAARDEAFKDVLLRRETASPAATLALPEGRYFARVTAQGAARLTSLPSPTRALRVVRLRLPEGAALRPGSIALPRGRSVEIGDPTGLELALRNVSFVKAPPLFGLPRGERAVVRLRVGGAADFLELLLEPAAVHAHIALWPANPVWPADLVQVRVRVDDAPQGFAPALAIRVDGAEVPVPWRVRDGLWETEIPPGLAPGPWVVRVEVRDGHGNEIGRAFMEVAGAGPR
jgi:hypothetical protein